MLWIVVGLRTEPQDIRQTPRKERQLPPGAIGLGHALGKGERRDAGDADGLYALVRVSLPPDLGKAPAFRGAWVAPAQRPAQVERHWSLTQRLKESWTHAGGGGAGGWPFGAFGASSGSHNPRASATDARANSETRSIVLPFAAHNTAGSDPRLLVIAMWTIDGRFGSEEAKLGDFH